MNRILSGRPKLKHYEAGMDLNLAYDRVESFRLFQGMIMEQYERMSEPDHFFEMDGTLPMNELQEIMRDVGPLADRARGLRARTMTPKKEDAARRRGRARCRHAQRRSVFRAGPPPCRCPGPHLARSSPSRVPTAPAARLRSRS